MLKLIQNASVYAPEYLGNMDVLIAGSKICQIGKNLKIEGNVQVNVIKAEDKIIVPGFIDVHQHIAGGGGEGGFYTRTPEVMLTELTLHGITTVIGCIGTDGICRDMHTLLAKAKSLDEEGISTFVYTGSYRVPVKTLTDSVMKDIMLFDKVIGVGEVAISDHRSSQPTFEELSRIVADARVAGMLSGKAGIVHLHLGEGTKCLDLIERIVNETEIPRTQFLPTHINRSEALFQQCLRHAKCGGYVDLTGNNDFEYWQNISDEVSVSGGIRRLLEAGVDSNLITISSDGQGSIPVFNEKKEITGVGVGCASCLLKEIKECVKNEKIPLEIALKTITENPAKILKLKGKGRIEEGYDADLCLLNRETLTVDTLIAKGKIMVTFESPMKKLV